MKNEQNMKYSIKNETTGEIIDTGLTIQQARANLSMRLTLFRKINQTERFPLWIVQA